MAQAELTPEQQRFAKACIGVLRDVLPHTFGEHHPTLIESWVFGLEVGMALGLDFPDQARRLLAVAIPEEEGGVEPVQDAQDFIQDALG